MSPRSSAAARCKRAVSSGIHTCVRSRNLGPYSSPTLRICLYSAVGSRGTVQPLRRRSGEFSICVFSRSSRFFVRSKSRMSVAWIFAVSSPRSAAASSLSASIAASFSGSAMSASLNAIGSLASPVSSLYASGPRSSSSSARAVGGDIVTGVLRSCDANNEVRGDVETHVERAPR
eukprot:30821-Pelagococcus_subviridis.AAC.13